MLRSYAVSFLVVASLTVAAFCLFGVLSIQHGWSAWHFARLQAYQTAKVGSLPEGALVLVGDSSLGNGVDARELSALLERPATSLALTGAYGFAGSLNMARRSFRAADVSAVVVMQTMDMPNRRISHKGLVYTAGTIGDALGAPVGALFSAYADPTLPINVALRGFRAAEGADGLEARDYMRQAPGPVRAAAPAEAEPLAPSWTEERWRYLDALGRECRAANVRCFYAVGPFAAPECAASPQYLAAVFERVRRSGLEPMTGTPLCIGEEALGDSLDHVAPDARSAFTQAFAQLLRARLAE